MPQLNPFQELIAHRVGQKMAEKFPGQSEPEENCPICPDKDNCPIRKGFQEVREQQAAQKKN